MASAEQGDCSEIELKFLVGAEAGTSLAGHPALSQTAQQSTLRSTYFDTPEHDLRNAGLSLRVREQDGAFVQTLKSQVGKGVFERGEWEMDLPNGEPDPALLAGTPAAQKLNGHLERIAPVFATRVERTTYLWSDGESAVEVSVDKGDVLAGEDSAPLLEVELELRSGEPKALFDLARELAQYVPMTISFQSKAERGYRLAGHEGAAAIRAQRAALSGEVSTEAAFRQIGRDCLRQISGNAELLATAENARVLHQTRVGVRRLRAALSIFAPILDQAGRAKAKDDCRWLAGELDAARNIDALAELLFGRSEDEFFGTPSLAALHQKLLRAQAEAHQKAGATARSARFSEVLLDLSSWLEIDPFAGETIAEIAAMRASPISTFAAERMERLYGRVRKLGKGFAEQDPESRHELRLQLKKLRYAAEFFTGVFDTPASRQRRFLDAAKALQDHLGELNDLTSARATALLVVGPRASELAFTAGELLAKRTPHETPLLASAKSAWRQLKDVTPFGRMKGR